jgi:secreted trypsin-like serine protease
VFALAACAGAQVERAKPAAKKELHKRPWSLSPPLGLSLPDEAVVHVLSRGVGCSGTLIAGSLVLTAHHCVVERDASGEILEKDLAASAVQVELGGDYLPWGTVRVRAIVTPDCGYRGGRGDIAILVLERKLVGVSLMPVRLSEPPGMGEAIEPIGFGRCLASEEAVHRTRRIGGTIDQVGPAAVSACASICPGDSGGPARSETTGELVGVVSAAVMDDTDRTQDPSTFTRVDVWRLLFANAQLIASGVPPHDLPPVGGCQPE